jgi:hypothetical protein
MSPRKKREKFLCIQKDRSHVLCDSYLIVKNDQKNC